MAAAKILTVAAAQMRFAASIDENCDWIHATVAKAAHAGADIILFPECAITGYNRDFNQIDERELVQAARLMSEAARKHSVNVLVGSPWFKKRRLYNALLVFDRRGRAVFRYAKIHLTPRDSKWFTPGNALAYFKLDGAPCTAIICHERRYPELARLPVMMGAQIIFHPNAGLDELSVSRAKRKGRDGIAVRAFENQAFYIFANSVGPQGKNLWSAGDSKIVGADGRVLALAGNRQPELILAKLTLEQAGRKYACEALEQPLFLRRRWASLIELCRRQLRKSL